MTDEAEARMPMEEYSNQGPTVDETSTIAPSDSVSTDHSSISLQFQRKEPSQAPASFGNFFPKVTWEDNKAKTAKCELSSAMGYVQLQYRLYAF